MICSLSRLKDHDLDQIRALESDVGKPLLAFSCHNVVPARLEEDELSRIQSLEKKLGISLVAVEG